MKVLDFFYITLCITTLLILYSYMVYPLLLWITSRIKHQKNKNSSYIDTTLPKVSVIIAAYNEELVIEEKILNSLKLDYPEELLEIIIGSDGSEDKTDEICRRYKDNINYIRIEQRQGKANVLNTVIPKANGEILLFSDANTIMESNCLKKMVSHFSNPEVGAVCGRLELIRSDKPIVSFERTYWMYESNIKKMESELHTTIGSNGGIYAVRSELVLQIPKDTIVDDFWISIDILQQDKKILFEMQSVAYEKLSMNIIEEFARKVRIGAGNLQVLLRRPFIRCQNKKLVNIFYYSHKVIRWSIPLLLIVFYISLFFLRGNWSIAILFILMNTSIIIALFGIIFEIKFKIIETISYFFLFNAALIIGYVKYLFGKQSVIWKIAKR